MTNSFNPWPFVVMAILGAMFAAAFLYNLPVPV